MTGTRIPTILVEGTHGGAGASTVASVLIDLAAAQLPTHVVDMSDVDDLRRLITHDGRQTQATYSFTDELPWAPADEVSRAVRTRLQGERPDAALWFMTTFMYHWDARQALEGISDLRVLVMDASARGADATARWIKHTEPMPTVVVVNAVANGTAGALGRTAVPRLLDQLDEAPEIRTIQRSVTIRGRLRDPRPSIELIRKHPMLDDYRAIWSWIRQTVNLPDGDTRSAEPVVTAVLH